MEEYKDVLTDDEEQRKMILHCVKKQRFTPTSLNLLWLKTTKPFFYLCAPERTLNNQEILQKACDKIK